MKTYPPMPLDDATINKSLQILRAEWPELFSLDRRVATKALNQLEQIVEAEGLVALTPARIQGIRNLVERFLVPLAAVIPPGSEPSPTNSPNSGTTPPKGAGSTSGN